MNATVTSFFEASIVEQPQDVRLLSVEERDRLIVSAVQIDGVWIIKSRFADDIWHLTGGTTNLSACQRKLDFNKVPSAVREAAKELMYIYQLRGREGQPKPKPYTLWSTLTYLTPFLRHLDRLKIKNLGAATPMACTTFVADVKARRRFGSQRKPLSPSSMHLTFLAVEFVYELSQFTNSPMPSHPWPQSTAALMSGGNPKKTTIRHSSKTPLIPDEVFITLFNTAYGLVQSGERLLSMRDALQQRMLQLANETKIDVYRVRNETLEALGWEGGFAKFTEALGVLRTACYIVIASLSGCRNHELAYLKTEAYHRTEDDRGESYWWMRSRSDKTGAGNTEWMIPDAAVQALRVIDRWAKPYQAMLTEEIKLRRARDPHDPEIYEAQRHVGAVFIGPHDFRDRPIRTLTLASWNRHLKAFATRCDLDWDVATHQFRRKFANYAARSQFGDLRYLREHFKHWSQDMTNDGYALNESQEMEIYAEIWDELEGIKLGLAEQWLSQNEPLAGGYGKNLVEWRTRRENVAIFKDHKAMVESVASSHAIRSNGHAWCTADDNQCIGNTMEKIRCSGCDNAVIGRFHARMYQNLYRDLKDLADCDDIGQGGQARVQRDLERCRDVLISLGYDPEAKQPA